MELLCLVVTILVLLLITLAICYDDRRPMSTNLKYKYRVKDNSIFRKIIKFKDRKHYPCNYFKIIPVYVFLLLLFLSLILLFVDIFTNGLITIAVSKKVFTIVALCIAGLSVLYFLVIAIWWEIVDYNEFKFTKAEKEELKRLRRFRDENKRIMKEDSKNNSKDNTKDKN